MGKIFTRLFKLKQQDYVFHLSIIILLDGNKRITILAMLVFLEVNGIKILCTDEELIELGLGIADDSIDFNNLLNCIIDHS